MKQLRNFGDDRCTAQCAYCGGDTLTQDHVPSRVLLDEPYPDNLPRVPSCRMCNEGFSLDEEYVACLIDCVLAGSSSPERAQRSKVQRILADTPALAARLNKACEESVGATRFSIEEGRVRNVVLKLGRGHALFELNEPQLGEPSSLWYAPLPLLTGDARAGFERLRAAVVWPEVGSRSMQRLAAAGRAEWVVVQPGRYRYTAFVGDGVIVRMVLSEYLAGEVIWA